MKRKRPPLPAESCPRKRRTFSVAEANISECPLTSILAQYGILESLASYLFPDDLFSLAAISKAAYKAIFLRPESRVNLLGKMQCDGEGIRIRHEHHRKSMYFSQFNCTEHAICGTDYRDRHVESRQCVSCQRMTCNECRVHLCYQSITQAPDEEDELSTYSGFVLLHDQEMGILSPAHLHESGLPWNAPYHDQGFLDMPLESAEIASPVAIEDILDINLGWQSLNLDDSSGTTQPSSIIRPFWDIVEKRKRSLCRTCFNNERKQPTSAQTSCNCTLRRQFLDRWLCLKCYHQEESELQTLSRSTENHQPQQCSCGQSLKHDTVWILCLWCHGEVARPSLGSVRHR